MLSNLKNVSSLLCRCAYVYLCVFWGGGGWGRISRVKSVSSNMKLVCYCCASVCVQVCVCVCTFLDEWVLLFLSSLIPFQVSRAISKPQPSTSSSPTFSHQSLRETLHRSGVMRRGMRGGGLGSRPKKMYGERLGDGVEYHLMSPTPRR